MTLGSVATERNGALPLDDDDDAPPTDIENTRLSPAVLSVEATPENDRRRLLGREGAERSPRDGEFQLSRMRGQFPFVPSWIHGQRAIATGRACRDSGRTDGWAERAPYPAELPAEFPGEPKSAPMDSRWCIGRVLPCLALPCRQCSRHVILSSFFLWRRAVPVVPSARHSVLVVVDG